MFCVAILHCTIATVLSRFRLFFGSEVTVILANRVFRSRGGGYSHILAIRVCAAGKGKVLKPFSLV